MTGYELSRKWFDFCFDNQDKIKPNHTALYFFIIEHHNRMGKVEKFGLPTTMAKCAIGISSYNTYINTLNDLVDWGFVKIITKSKNQFSSNIVALSNFNKATTKALDKALIKQGTKHVIKQRESIGSIIKQDNKEQIEGRKLKFASTLKPFLPKYGKKMLNAFYTYWTEPNKSNTKFKQELERTWSLPGRLETWAANEMKFGSKKSPEPIEPPIKPL